VTGPGEGAADGSSGGAVGDGPVTVMVVDDHPMWRDGVARDLSERGFRVVATAPDAAAAVRIAVATRPRVVLMDLNLGWDIGGSGVEAITGILVRLPDTRILVLSASGEHADVLAAVTAGARGYLVKSASITELEEAVRRTAAGVAVFTPGLAGLVLGEFRRRQRRDAEASDVEARDAAGRSGGRGARPGRRRGAGAGAGGGAGGAAETGDGQIRDGQLTERETEVLRLVATGMTARQIAERLVLSHRTVESHVQNTLRKLQLGNRVELTRYAVERGLAEDR
jgi:DNA-binding NarL/FixJ family response regulator